MLIEHGSNVKEKDDSGDEPVHAAAKSKNCNSVYILKEAGANMCAKGMNIGILYQHNVKKLTFDLGK